MAREKAESRSWETAIGLVAVWWGTREEHRQDAVAKRLAELGAAGGPAAVEEAALGLADVAGMFIELYADCMGAPLDAILEEATSLGDADDSPPS